MGILPGSPGNFLLNLDFYPNSDRACHLEEMYALTM